MTSEDSIHVPDDWWPSALSDFSKEQPLADEYVVVAEISSPWAPDSDKRLYTALVPTGRMPDLITHRGCIGHEVSASGPSPSSIDDEFQYEPSFWIEGLCDKEYFEPLVVSWESAGKTILLPDQGFLMTYGLMPRLIETGEAVWDDPTNRVFNVVKVEPPSEFSFRLLRGSRVSIRREYLQDYATVRSMSLLQTYYVSNATEMPDPLSETLAKRGCGDLKLPCRMLDVRFDARNSALVLAQMWGYRHLLDPGVAPVSIDSDYGILDWPGYGVVNGSIGMRHHRLPPACKYVYVRDAVLGEYEGRPGFTIFPESGSVKYGGQWSVGYCQRIGRDLIQVELKKLYEGNHPRTVETWFKYCVSPPPISALARLRSESNIAKRAKAVVYGMAAMGEVLAVIASEATGVERTSKDVVSLDRAQLDYYGWSNDRIIEPIARHAPIEMHEGAFLARCMDLFKVVGEGLSQDILRKTLLKLAINEEEIEKFGSLKILERLVQLAIVANMTGLNLMRQGAELEARRKENAPLTSVQILIAISRLRNQKGHRSRESKADLTSLGICAQKMAPGWGEALDIVYDRTIDALLDIRKALAEAMGC